MLEYTDLKPNTNFLKDGQPYKVLTYDFEKKQRQKPTVKLTIKNLITEKTKEITVRQHQEFEKAEIKEIPAEFIYHHRGEYWFKDPDDPSERFKIDEEIVGDAKKYLKEELEVSALKFKNDFISLEIPPKVNLKVVQAPPNVKGSTVDGATKTVETETGYEVKTPVFIEKEDLIKVNTETGKYVERAEKND